MPCRISASAAVSPPMPPPTIATLLSAPRYLRIVLPRRGRPLSCALRGKRNTGYSSAADARRGCGNRDASTSACLLIALAPHGAGAAQNAPTREEIEVYAGLHEAAAKGDVAEIERLIKAGEKPNIQDSQEPHAAARRGLYASSTRRRARCSSSAPTRTRSRSTATTSSPSPRWRTTSRCSRSRSTAAAAPETSPAAMTAQR